MNNFLGDAHKDESFVVEIDSGVAGDMPVPILKREVAIMAGRFSQLLRRRFSDDTTAVAISLQFMEFRYREVYGDTPLEHWHSDCRTRIADHPDSSLWQLISRLKLQLPQIDMLLIAGLTEEHEGFADIFRTLHPENQPLPTIGLAAQLVCPDGHDRSSLRALIEPSTGNYFSIFNSDGEQPFFTRSLRLAEGLWSWLYGIDLWPRTISVNKSEPVSAGLSEWLAEDEVQQVSQLLQLKSALTLILTAETLESAINRASVLCQYANIAYRIIEISEELDSELLRLLQLHCLMRDIIPIIHLPSASGSSCQRKADFGLYPLPVIVCTQQSGSSGSLVDNRPIRCLQVRPLSFTGLRSMWRTLLPELVGEVNQLAARYPFEPVQAQLICADLQHVANYSQRSLSLADVTGAVRSRSASALSGSIRLIHPVANWSSLVLPAAQLSQLEDAANRLFLQSKVLDDWQFLSGRRGARGVRMLFSGPPGTGKTLSAEVMANVLGVDLLEVDLSSVVSKWIGETEKNLADIFNAAETTRAVLFFDEADALFGKRTEVSDAHDRYANLETAYLLSRIERYDGLAILATNYRQNIDAAFSRRLDFIIEFEEPGFEERVKLWQCHIPKVAPLCRDVNLPELASLFPIVGGHIRNATVSAAYFAAQAGSEITRQHFFDAIRREYEKSGKAYREVSRR